MQKTLINGSRTQKMRAIKWESNIAINRRHRFFNWEKLLTVLSNNNTVIMHVTLAAVLHCEEVVITIEYRQ